MSRLPAIRAGFRIARRDAWRNKGRSALIAVMVALPVLAASTVSVIYHSDQNSPRDNLRVTAGSQAQAALTLGDGQPIEQAPDGVNSSPVDPGSDDSASKSRKSLTIDEFQAKVQAVISPRDRIVPNYQLSTSRSLRFRNHVLDSGIREFDYTTPGVGGLVRQISGRAPKRAGEVVISRSLARHAGVHVGDQLSYRPTRAGTGTPLTVVGIVGGLALIGDRTVIGPPGTLLPAEAFNPPPGHYSELSGPSSLLVTGPDPVTWSQVQDLNQFGSVVTSRAVINDPPPSDQVTYDENMYSPGLGGNVVGIGVVVIGLVLLQIALLAGPAIAVGARRNQRGLAIMMSTGAERKHLRTVVLATSGVIGLASCLAAAALGSWLGSVIVVVLRRKFEQQLVSIHVQPLDLIAFSLVGGLTAIAAALIPARQAGRMDVVAALTGRRGQSAPRLRVPLIGLGVTAIGITLAYLVSRRNQPLLTVIGLALAEVGLVTAAGAIVALAARGARWLPFAPRFALRDAARQRGRTAPAVAAVLAAIAGGTASLIFISGQAQYDRDNYSPSSRIGVVTLSGGQETLPADYADLQATLRRTLPVDRVVTFHGINNQGDTNAYLSLQTSAQNTCPLDTEAPLPLSRRLAALRTDPRCLSPVGPHAISYSGSELFDDGSALTVLTGTDVPADDAALRAGRVLVFDPLLLWPDGTVHVEVERDTSGGFESKQTVTLPGQVSTRAAKLTFPVYPLSAARPLGVKVQALGLLAGTTTMPTATQEKVAGAEVSDQAGAYLSVERGYHDSYAIGLIALVVAAGIVTLGGTFSAVGLAAAEGRADVATLAAVGASPGVRRRLAASQAAVIVGLGAGLGLLSGVLGGWILIRMQQSPPSTRFFDPGELTATRWRMVLPWVYLLATGLGVPALAVAIGFLSTRSRLPMLRRLGQ